MIKDTADAAMEAYEAWVRSNAPFTMTGLLSNDIFIAGYDEAMARECEWTEVYGRYNGCDGCEWGSMMYDFCPNCGGRVVVKEAK